MQNHYGVCVPGCVGNTPICDTSRGSPYCAVCTAKAGCSGLTPHCDTSVFGGRCVASCDVDGSCSDGGVGGGGAGGGSASGGGGAGGGDTGGGSASGGGGAAGGGTGGGGPVDAGTYMGPNTCAPHTPPMQSCTPNCREGFHCDNSQCVLNGGGGPVQVTLRWNAGEDLDLHVEEPTSGGGHCEIWYGDKTGTSCGALGSLDLDSNAACTIDNVDIENVIYPAGSIAPSGTYNVLVDYYMNCDSSLTALPFEVEARFNGMTVGMCGVFLPGDPDWDDDGSAGSGRLVMSFTVP